MIIIYRVSTYLTPLRDKLNLSDNLISKDFFLILLQIFNIFVRQNMEIV